MTRRKARVLFSLGWTYHWLMRAMPWIVVGLGALLIPGLMQ